MEQREMILIGIAGVIVFLMVMLLAALGVVVFFIIQPAGSGLDVSTMAGNLLGDNSTVAPIPTTTVTPEPSPTPLAASQTCSSPSGGEEDVVCVEDKVMKCTNSEWVELATCHSANACKAGACTAKTCADPDAYEGEFICSTSDDSKTEKRTLYQCTSDNTGQVGKNWVIKEVCTSVANCDATAGTCL